MKTYNNIFTSEFVRAVGVVVALMLPMGAFAATSTGCEEGSQNEYINPELALCTTHVFNIGGTTNPDNAAQREIMRDVIALKTTIMTQQMYKQYEYLDATIKRLKTQLEKAILTTKLQAAGADSSSSSGSLFGSSSGGSFRSSDSNIKLAGAQNCKQTSYDNAHSCLTSNIRLVMNAVNGGNNIGEAKRQLEVDLEAARTWGIIKGNSGKYTQEDGKTSLSTNCNKLKNDKNVILGCAEELNALISKAAYDMQQKQNMYNRNNSQP